jgi:hypothetical protein
MFERSIKLTEAMRLYGPQRGSDVCDSVFHTPVHVCDVNSFSTLPALHYLLLSVLSP